MQSLKCLCRYPLIVSSYLIIHLAQGQKITQLHKLEQALKGLTYAANMSCRLQYLLSPHRTRLLNKGYVNGTILKIFSTSATFAPSAAMGINLVNSKIVVVNTNATQAAKKLGSGYAPSRKNLFSLASAECCRSTDRLQNHPLSSGHHWNFSLTTQTELSFPSDSEQSVVNPGGKEQPQHPLPKLPGN